VSYILDVCCYPVIFAADACGPRQSAACCHFSNKRYIKLVVVGHGWVAMSCGAVSHCGLLLAESCWLALQPAAAVLIWHVKNSLATRVSAIAIDYI
jgi:hypothetical protein